MVAWVNNRVMAVSALTIRIVATTPTLEYWGLSTNDNGKHD